MNIQMQICGMIILILLTVFYKSNKTLELYAEKVFFRALCFTMVSLSLDIISLVAIEYRMQLPMLFVNFICKTYIISLFWVGLAALLYVLTDVLTEKIQRRRSWQLVIITIVQSLIIYALPIYIHETTDEVYTYGPSVMTVYVFAVGYVVATLVILYVFRNRVNKRRRFAVTLWMLVWIVAALIQFFNNELLVVGFASAIGILILLVIMENPESNLDRRLGCFNSYALSEYVKEMLQQGKKFSMLSLSFGNVNLLEERRFYAEELFRGVLGQVKKQKNIMSFRNTNSDLLFVSDDEEALYRAGCDVLEYLTKDEELHKETRLFLVKSCKSFTTVEELFGFLVFLYTDYGTEKEKVFPVGKSIIETYKQQYIVEQKITEALAEDRVEVFLQPIFDTAKQRFTSAEALVRIREKDGTLLSPGIFIPVAEDSGQILELGERVFDKVCEFLKNSEAIALGIDFIEVNLSVIQCERRDLSERLISSVEKYGVSPSRINFEITETASISARATLLANMKKLIEYGFKFSLDDFGKGESNLMYVVEMPVSFVKLDMDITKAFMKSLKAKQVVRAVVSMAHGMELKLVAEGIETEEELERMCQEGIDYIQGFFYSKPLPMTEFLEFIRKNK